MSEATNVSGSPLLAARAHASAGDLALLPGQRAAALALDYGLLAGLSMQA